MVVYKQIVWMSYNLLSSLMLEFRLFPVFII